MATTYYIPPNTSKSIYCGRRAPITPTSTSDCAGLLAHLNTAMDKVPSELLASSTRLRPGIPFRTPTNCIRSCRTDSDHRPPSSMGGKPYYAFEEHIITHPAPPSRGSSAGFYVVRPCAPRTRVWGHFTRMIHSRASPMSAYDGAPSHYALHPSGITSPSCCPNQMQPQDCRLRLNWFSDRIL